MYKKNITTLLILLVASDFAQIDAIQFTLKGGASNSVDIALFKNRANFEEFIERVGGSKESARAVEKFTKENTILIASTGGAVITGIAIVASQGALTPASGAINSVAVAGLTAATVLSGKLAHTGANIIKSFAKDYASHYFESMKLATNNTVCRGMVGDKLVRRRDFPSGNPDFMNFTKPQPMYLVVFNKEKVADPYNSKTIISEPYTVIFAGEIKPEHLGSSFDIRTEVISYYDTDKSGNKKLNEAGYPIVLERVIGVKLDIIDKEGGLICTTAHLPQASKVAVYAQWAAGLNHILESHITDETVKLDYDQQLATRIVNQLTKTIGFLEESDGKYLLADNKKISVKNVQDSITKINMLITQTTSKKQLSQIVIAVDNLLKDFEYYVRLTL